MTRSTRLVRNLALLLLVVLAAAALLMPRPGLSQDLSDADRATNNTVALGEGEAPAEWLGETPHFVMVGDFGAYHFDVHVMDLADVELSAKREYEPAGEGLAYIDFEIALNLVTEGIERTIELEFENADFSAHAVPGTYALQTAEFPEGELSNMELQFEWEWVEKSIVVNEEALAGEGTLTIALETGEAIADKTLPNGLIGGFARGLYDGKTVAVSFTAPVTEAEIDG